VSRSYFRFKLNSSVTSQHSLTVQSVRAADEVALMKGSVADPDPNPDPPDPRVFGPPGSGSTSQRYGSGSGSRFLLSCKNSKKNLDSYYFVTLFDFLSLKNDVVRGMDPRIRIHPKMSWIRNTDERT
jgi:hypothetical protein